MFRVNFFFLWAVCILVAHALDCEDPRGVTISSLSDVVALNKCVNITASLTITSSAPSDIQLNGLKALAKLNATAAKSLHSISSSTLVEIDTIALADLPALHSLNFSALSVLDTLELRDLPALENVTFGASLGPRSVVSVVNTGLESVEWVKWPVSTSLNISTNADLAAVSLPWDSVDSTVTVTGNDKLEKLDVEGIESITGSFTVEANKGLVTLEFGALESVKGDVRLDGSFKNVSMPVLGKVTGALAVASTEDMDQSCAEMAKVDEKGKVTCTSNAQPDPPASLKLLNSPENPPSPSSSSNPQEGQEEGRGEIATGAKIGIIIAAVILGLFLVVGAVFFFRARSRGKVREIVILASVPIPTRSVSTKSSGQSVKSVDSVRSVSFGNVERAEARVVGTRAGDVKVLVNGEEMTDLGIFGAGRERGGVGGIGMKSDASLKSVSSVGSEVPLVRREPSA
ncbi:hypothetical protein PMIN04_004934 [Paraphaeosphaeria minitans]